MHLQGSRMQVSFLYRVVPLPHLLRAAGSGPGVNNSRGGETTDDVGQDTCELGVSSPAWPAREAGGKPTARDGAGGRGLSAETRARRGPHGARHFKTSRGRFNW